MTDFISISLRFFQQARSFQIFFYLNTDIESVHTDIHSGSIAYRTVIVKNIDTRQIILFAQHIVVDIMCRSDFQTTRTEFDIDIIIFDDGNYPVYQRNNNLLSF